MQTAHLDRKQPPNPNLHYAEQLEKQKTINTSLLAACHKQNSWTLHIFANQPIIYSSEELMLQLDKNLTPVNC